MQNTTLCYVTDGDRVLMLHRVKKHNDLNEGKWIGVGGHMEENETPEECVDRETFEETGLTLTNRRYCGLVTFVSDRWEGEYMHLFVADGFTGEVTDCSEGVLRWVDRKDLFSLPMWPGDRIFLRLAFEKTPFFSLKLVYRGDTLTSAVLNGTPLDI